MPVNKKTVYCNSSLSTVGRVVVVSNSSAADDETIHGAGDEAPNAASHSFKCVRVTADSYCCCFCS